MTLKMCWFISDSSPCHRATRRLPDQEKRRSPARAIFSSLAATSLNTVEPRASPPSSAIRITIRPTPEARVVKFRPFTKDARSRMVPIRQPLGSESPKPDANAEGTRSCSAGETPNARRPSALATTGSKSTNHERKSAAAVASRVWFMRRLDCSFASIDHNSRAIPFCSCIDGRSNSNASIREGAVCTIFVPEDEATSSLFSSRHRNNQ